MWQAQKSPVKSWANMSQRMAAMGIEYGGPGQI